MKKSLLLASSVFALFTSIGANALTWTGSEDLSSINAQIVDGGGTNYVLSPIAASPIIGSGIQIDDSGATLGLMNSFTFDSGDVGNPYIVSGSQFGNGILNFNLVEVNDVTLSGDITNTTNYGRGVYFNDSVIHNALNIAGSITSYDQAINVLGGSVGSFTSTADVTATHDDGIFLSNTSVTGAVNISGAIESNGFDGGIYMNTASADSFTSTANLTTINRGDGIVLLDTTIANDVNIAGTMNVHDIGVSISGGSMGSFTSTADITGEYGISLFDTTVTNGINVGGTIDASGSGNNGVFIRNTTADSFTYTGDITGNWGIRLDTVDIAGAITIGGTFSTDYPYSHFYIGQGDSTAGSIVINSGYFYSSTNATITVSGAVNINSSDGASLVDLTANSLTVSAANINSGHHGLSLEDVVLTNNLDLSAVTTVTGTVGLNFDNVVSANGIDLSSITTVTATNGAGLSFDNTVLPSITSAIDVTASTYGISLVRLDGTGTVDLSGTVDAGYSGVSLSSSTIDSFISSGDITAGLYYGLQLSSANITNTMNVSGTIDSVRSGLYAYNGSINSLTSTADMTSSTEAGFYLRSMTLGTSTISGTINGETYGLYLWTTAGGDITSTANITANTEHGVYLYSGSSIDSFVNNGSITSTAKAAIAGDTGGNVLNYSGTGTLSGATYDIDMAGGADTVNLSNTTINDLSVNSAENINVAADATIGATGLVATGVTTSTVITNDGDIAGVVMDDLNSVLTYGGAGTLSGETYDIDMGAGADVLNITGVTMAAPSLNNAERVNVFNSVFQLDLTDANKGTTLLTLDGTNQLDLFNVTFDMNSTATLADGDELVLASVAGIDGTNLNTLMINLTGFDGAFSIVDNAGTEELVFTLGADVPAIPPGPSTPTTSDTFVSSGAVATQISNASTNVIQGRTRDKRLQGRRLKFTSLYSDTMYDIYEEPRSQLWVEGFGLSGAYDGNIANGLNPYDTTLSGAVIGYDYNWGSARTGIAFTHATGEIEGEQNVFNIDVESLSGSLYSVFDFDNVYIEAAASFGTTTFDQNFGGTISSYDATNMGGLMRVGLKLHAGNIGFEQFAGFQYKNVIVDEHSNGVDTIEEYNQEMFKAELGFVTSYQMLLASGNAIVPYVRLELGNDFAKNATLTNLDNSGAAVGSLETVDLGDVVSRVATGVSFLTQDSYSIGAEYEYESRDRYEAHIGKIKGRLKF